MMNQVAEVYLGNITQDNLLAQKIASAQKSGLVLEVKLQNSDRNKGRIHAQSICGVTIGIIKSRDLKIQEGDVFQTTRGNLLLIHLEAETLMVLDFTEKIDSGCTMKLVRLGHLLGNQHYPIKVEGDRVYVRLSTDTRVITQMIEELNISGLTIGWEQGSVFEDTNFSQHSH